MKVKIMGTKTHGEVIADMQVAADRMGLEINDLQEMIVSVLNDCKEKAVRLRSTTAISDQTTIKTISHNIKGSAANYGLNELAELAKEIERNRADLPLEKVDNLLNLIDHLLTLDLAN